VIAFEQLVAEARACQLCAACMPVSPRPVFQLHPEAKIVIVSQAPGRKVHETGVPFNDASGERLRAWLGVTRAQFYDPQHFAILPMGLCYPGKGKSGDLPPRSECAPRWHSQLLTPLYQVELMLIVGKYAMNWHLPDALGLTEAVRQVDVAQEKNIPLPHPSPANNRWFARNPWFEEAVAPALRARVARLLEKRP